MLRLPLRRGLKTDALARLTLDINAAHSALQLAQPTEPQQPVTRSAEALRGEAPLRGDVVLPRELVDAVEGAISEADDGPALRLNALSLYSHLRSTSSIAPPPTSYRAQQAALTTYDPPTSLAFLAGLMPSIYAATLYALRMARQRLEMIDGWTPERVVDWGAGVGSAAWAVEEVWPAVVAEGKEQETREYVGLEGSRAMVELGSRMLGALPARITKVEGGDGRFEGTPSLPSRLLHLTLPASSSTLAKLHLAPSSSLSTRTLALSSFSLADLPSKEKRRDWIRGMWDSGAEVMVIVERGTPAGARLVKEAREQLLMLGRRNKSWESELEEVEQGRGAEKGCWVMAPCPHELACPLHHSTKSYCHFSQRVQSPPFLRQTKHTTRGSDDSKFSYVVIRRESRPSSTSSSSPSASLLERALEMDAAEAARSAQEGAGEGAGEEGKGELRWPRMVAPPLKRSGHVILEVCTEEGSLQRHTIPKSQGRQAYYDARKSSWGDTFPHAPKNGPQSSPSTVPSAMMDSAERKDKFTKGAMKVKGKKESRREGRDFGVEEERARGGRGTGKKRREGDESGVQDFELMIGVDGQFRIM